MTKAKSRIRVAWDSCVWIDFFQQTTQRYRYIKAVMDAAEAGDVLIVTSTLALAETFKCGGTDGAKDLEQIRLYFKHKHIHVEAAHRSICELAQEIQILSNELNQKNHTPKVKPVDAVQLATAAFTNTPYMLTVEGERHEAKFGRSKRLLGMDNAISLADGSAKLRVMTPRQWVKETGIGTQLNIE